MRRGVAVGECDLPRPVLCTVDGPSRCRPGPAPAPHARPYDLRHAAVSLWLNAGVHAPEAAERAGHGVDVMLRVYAKCSAGQREIANQRIEGALAS